MIIRLPRSFMYTSRGGEFCAYVENGILYVEGIINYEDLMYTLTYELYGYGRCYYCGKLLSTKDRTLDHVYPRCWGGISITNNLRPSCRSCNGTKSDMTINQFKRYSKIKSHDEQHNFHQACIRKNENIVNKRNFIIPSSWITMYDASKLMDYISFKRLELHKMEKLEEYYDNYHHYPHPIIVSSNNWLFKGKHILYHAKKIGNNIVPAIILENVIVKLNTSRL